MMLVFTDLGTERPATARSKDPILTDERRPTNSRSRTAFRWLGALFFIVAGIMHFVTPVPYRQIIPPGFPSPALLVVISGICEIAGGAGLLVPRLRRAAAIGLILLLIAVYPANIYMVHHPDAITGIHSFCCG
jgi:uncharacterized membrane protein